MSVCVCLVGFASLQSTWAHTLRHPCLACSSRCTEYCHSHNNCKKTIIPQKSPSHLPPLSKVRCCRRKNSGDYRRNCRTNPRPTPTLAKPHHTIRFSCCEFDSPTYRKNKIRPRFHGGELIKSLIYKY